MESVTLNSFTKFERPKHGAQFAYESMLECIHTLIAMNNVERVYVPIQDKHGILAVRLLNDAKNFTKFKIKLIGYDLGEAYPFDREINKSLPPYKRYNLKAQFEETINGRKLTPEYRLQLAKSYIIYQCTVFTHECLSRGETAYFLDPSWIEAQLKKYDVTLDEMIDYVNSFK